MNFCSPEKFRAVEADSPGYGAVWAASNMAGAKNSFHQKAAVHNQYKICMSFTKNLALIRRAVECAFALVNIENIVVAKI